MADRRILGVDLLEEALERARGLAREAGMAGIDYRRADMNRLQISPAGCQEALQLEENAFDIVFFHQSLHHVENLEGCLAAVRRALGIAEWLFSSPRRIGKFRPEYYDEVELERSARIRNIDVVDSRVRTDFLGHAYFLSNPATLSDVILKLRYDRAPGTENGRPLTEVAPNFYILDDNYPQQAAPLPKAAAGR